MLHNWRPPGALPRPEPWERELPQKTASAPVQRSTRQRHESGSTSGLRERVVDQRRSVKKESRMERRSLWKTSELRFGLQTNAANGFRGLNTQSPLDLRFERSWVRNGCWICKNVHRDLSLIYSPTAV